MSTKAGTEDTNATFVKTDDTTIENDQTAVSKKVQSALRTLFDHDESSLAKWAKSNNKEYDPTGKEPVATTHCRFDGDRFTTFSTCGVGQETLALTVKGRAADGSILGWITLFTDAQGRQVKEVSKFPSEIRGDVEKFIQRQNSLSSTVGGR